MERHNICLDWNGYYSLIASQRRRHPITQREIHVFDHPDYSYLQEIDRCRAIFQQYPSFATMPREQRRLIAGWGGSGRHYLGNMKGAGYFKQLVLESPQVIAENLDRIPMDGLVSINQLQGYLGAMLQLRGVAIATATRLLAVKRPDCFLPVTGRSRQQIRQTLGHPATQKGYVDLHKYIWSLLWFAAPKPVDAKEQRVWHARVALLDVLFYEILPR